MPLPINGPDHRTNGAVGCAALALSTGLLVIGAPSGWSRAVGAAPSAVHASVQIAQANPASPNPVLMQPGAEGDDVSLLQRQMQRLGLYQGPIDGRYDSATETAIATFQTSVGLPASGNLDRATWQRLSNPPLLGREAIAAPAPPALFSPAIPVTDGAPLAQSPATTENAPEPTEAATAQNETAAPPQPAADNRRLGWWLVGSLGLLASLGGWLLLGRGKQCPPSRATVPPQPQPEPLADRAIPTTSAPSDALVAADLPLEATTRLSPVDIVDSLVNELASADSATRRHAIWELGQRGNSDAIQPLVNGLLQADSQEKSLVLAALAEISSRSLKPMHRALALGLQDPSPEVRKNAIRDLSRVYDTVVQLSHMLAHASQDPDPGVQETAQWALSQLNRIPAAAYPNEAATLDAADGEGHRLPPS